MAESDDKDQEDRTEQPTQRRLDQAAERGDVPRSSEVNTWFVLAGGTLALMIAANTAAGDLGSSLKAMLTQVGRDPADSGALRAYGEHALTAGLMALALPLGLVLLAALAGTLIQNRPSVTTEPLMPQFSRISPLSGLRRVFGKEAFVQFLKGLAKIGVVGGAMFYAVWPERARLESFVTLDVRALLPATQSEALRLLFAVLAIYAFVAGGDYLYQRLSWYRRQRMTREELKQEFKETEGNPEIKAKIRQMRQQAARRRMMAKVPKATVVVMNPTHFAVALQYERGMAAPVCVAKGLDSMALRIRAVAEENGVPVVENPPLARALYKAVELDQDIPVEHYKAVAEVIGYVMRLRGRRA
jgi:flagellar biosynthetic protein FlhB